MLGFLLGLAADGKPVVPGGIEVADGQDCALGAVVAAMPGLGEKAGSDAGDLVPDSADIELGASVLGELVGDGRHILVRCRCCIGWVCTWSGCPPYHRWGH